MDPFLEKDPSVTSVMGSLLASSDSLNRSWKYRGGANLVTFTLTKKQKMSQIVTILLGVLFGVAAGLLIQALIPNLAGDIATRIIMPITNANQVERAIKLSGSFMPQRFKAIVDYFGSDPEAMKQAGIAYATDQIIDLYANGITNVHVYSMNKPDVAAAIMNNLSDILWKDFGVEGN